MQRARQYTSPKVKLFHGHLCYITFITHKNDAIILLSNFTEPLAYTKFDNDYDVILCVIIAYPTTGHGIWGFILHRGDYITRSEADT